MYLKLGNGIETIDGVDYINIAPTSTNDNPAGSLRPGRTSQGWIQQNGNVYVPVERTTEFRIFSRKVNND
jgi:hypothetical protein